MSKQEHNADIDDILKRFTAGQSTPEEYDRVVRWFEGLDSKEKLTVDKAVQAQIRKRLWATLETRIQKQAAPRQRSRTISFMLPVGIAASLLIVAALIIYNSNTPALQETANTTIPAFNLLHKESNTTNENRIVVLDDQTRIVLSPNSYITFNDVLHDTLREVTLHGEAFFDVTPNKQKPFKVYTYDVVTTVVGTSFTIKARSVTDSVIVAVSTGKVVVSSHTQEAAEENSSEQKVVILPNQQAVFSPQDRKLTASLVQEPVAMTKPATIRSVYDEAPITAILQELEKMYGVEIVYDETELAQCKITTAFTNETLFKKLDILATAIGATYAMEGTHITFRSNGCN
jgi:transmembrane sensor